jgi:hypothetical protein
MTASDRCHRDLAATAARPDPAAMRVRTVEAAERREAGHSQVIPDAKR